MKVARIKPSNSILSGLIETFQGLRSIFGAEIQDDNTLEAYLADPEMGDIARELNESSRKLDRDASDYVSNIGTPSTPKKKSITKLETKKETETKIEKTGTSPRISIVGNIDKSTDDRNISYFKGHDDLDR